MIQDRPGLLLVLLITIRDRLRYVRMVVLDVIDAVRWACRERVRLRQLRHQNRRWLQKPIEPGAWIEEK